MPTETVLNDPLTGLEIKKWIADHVIRSLNRDCYLKDDVSMRYAKAHIRIEWEAEDFNPAVKGSIDETLRLGKPSGEEDIEPLESDFNVESRSPNDSRVESGQPVPVQAKNAEGKPETRYVKYPRPKAK